MSKFKFGLQLFSVRDDMAENMESTLKAVSEMGYECVEFAGYFGKTAEEVKALCDKYNLIPISVHQTLNVFFDDPQKNIDFLKTLGVKYCGISCIRAEVWEADYESTAAQIKEAGTCMKDAGIKYLYHNHDFELCMKRGESTLLDALYNDIPADILSPELDLCWVHYSGNDPIEYVKKYGEVSEVVHLKDFMCKNLAAGPVYDLIDDNGNVSGEKRDKDADGFEFRAIGYGRQDIPGIMKALENTNAQYIIVEQDGHTTEKTALEDAKDSIDYLKSLGY